jgi:signal transduction histidine kinase
LQLVYEKNRQELLVGIAHDLATPLTKITGYTSGLLEGIADTPEKQRHYLELVRSTSQSMASAGAELVPVLETGTGQSRVPVADRGPG